jgi:hypothetical protein
LHIDKSIEGGKTMFSKESRRKISSVLTFVLLFSMLVPAMALGAEAVQLKDIADSYAQKEIQALVDGGVISGYEDGSFQPRKAMSRAELAKIIVLSLGLKENADKASAFTDVAKNAWYTGFVGALVESGITQGTSAATFAPEAKVTREELVVFFVRAMGLEEAAGKLAVDAKLSDLKQVSSWAQAHVSLAFKVGFVNGIDDSDGSLKFSPKDNAERQALARLAFEFKNNKSKFVDAAKALAAVTVGELAITSVSTVSNTSIEVTFNKDVASVNTADFTFDNGLTVTNAELKAGSTTVVVLTTSAQTLDTVYKLSYKGKDTNLTVKGILAAFIGGGGSSRSGNRNNPALSDLQKINQSGQTFADLTLTYSGTDWVGPATGTTYVTGTLTLNPGDRGELYLRNIEAEKIVVSSGGSQSVHLTNITVKNTLTVDVGSQKDAVRVVSEGTTKIAKTDVKSKAIIEATEGTFGAVSIGAGADVTLKGSINGEVSIVGDGAKVAISAPTAVAAKSIVASAESAKKTSIKSLKVGANASITADAGTSLGSMSITAKGITISLSGAGEILAVTVEKGAEGVSLTIGAGSGIKAITLNANVTLSGDAAAIGAIPITAAPGVVVSASETLIKDIRDKAIAAIIAIPTFFNQYSKEVEDKIIAAETLANNAKVLGVKESALPGYGGIETAKVSITNYAFDAAYWALRIFADRDFEIAVTKNLTLPTSDPDRGVAISWSSSNTSVVSNTGVVTRPAIGKPDAMVELTATFTKYGKQTSIRFYLTILAEGSVAPTLSSITSTPSTVTFTTYGTQQLAISANYSNGGKIDATNAASYVSSNATVATVSITGLVTAKANGTTVVTVSFEGKTFNVNVSVNVSSTGTVTSVTYVTYAQTVTSLVYGNQSGSVNSLQSPLYIPAANEAGYLIVAFNESLKTDVTGVKITSNLSASAATYSVNGATYNYLAIEYGARAKGASYGVTISGLKRASDGTIMPTVTIFVYQR